MWPKEVGSILLEVFNRRIESNRRQTTRYRTYQTKKSPEGAITVYCYLTIIKYETFYSKPNDFFIFCPVYLTRIIFLALLNKLPFCDNGAASIL
jgi:hypothetical protein